MWKCQTVTDENHRPCLKSWEMFSADWVPEKPQWMCAWIHSNSKLSVGESYSCPAAFSFFFFLSFFYFFEFERFRQTRQCWLCKAKGLKTPGRSILWSTHTSKLMLSYKRNRWEYFNDDLDYNWLLKDCIVNKSTFEIGKLMSGISMRVNENHGY